MSNHRDISHAFREVSRIAYEFEGYNRNSFIVEGSRRLASMIERGFFPEETCHWIAKSILPHNRCHLGLLHAIEYHFDPDFAEVMRLLVFKLSEVARTYIPEREGTDNPNFSRIITTPSRQFTTFFPGNTIDNYSDMEAQAYENILEQSDFSSNTSSDTDSDGDDLIDPENAPEYEQYAGSLPLYENRHQDELLLSDESPVYSEFSLEMMLLTMERSLV